ncbi:hypothetical protein [Paraliomyxa miuraensis]|uniref:hypothetical protein n=1 Tax=Paraliomyxa miuraensis TaxID=376150 RepID=UPI00224F63F0|nr:hypothetical protein [Paraliomyxa miuraensis]MCX4242491.1 hypothetical protein [Paraliomyxa miuraensis]
MKTSTSLLLLCSLLSTTACLGGTLDDGGQTDTDADTDTDDTTTGPPVPLQCGYGGEILEDGDQVDSPDGCVSYLCQGGGLSIVEDRRVTIDGDLPLASQEAVDEQSCLGVVQGTVTISGTAADLTPLAPLYRIDGELQVIGSAATSLTGLEGLTEVGSHITIADNASLTALSLSYYLSAFGDVTIQNNDALTSLAGAEFIGQCGNCIAVSHRPGALADRLDAQAEPAGDGGADQPPGGNFYGNILIADNDVLADVWAISNLYWAWANVTFRNNAALTTLVGLQLNQVQGNLEISDHAAMPTADAEAFAAGIAVQGTTTICGNQGGTPCG